MFTPQFLLQIMSVTYCIMEVASWISGRGRYSILDQNPWDTMRLPKYHKTHETEELIHRFTVSQDSTVVCI
jgi:hypothetical protein